MDPKKPLANLGRLSGAGKWITVSVTTIAAIVGILVNAKNLGLTPWLNVGSISFADLAARRVLLSPATDTLEAIGDTLHLAATVTDEHGATLAGATILWKSDDSLVAVVDSAGGVAARGPGSATITATVREHVGRSRVTVWQRVRSVAIEHDTLVRLPEGTTVQLVARALDARGHAVAGRVVRWQTADSGIVAIDAGGSASAAAPGRTTLTASTDGYSAIVGAEVALTAASIKLLAGADQRAPAGKRLPQPVQLQVFSRGGRPVPDAIITFGTKAGEGSVTPDNASTDRNGRTRATWTLGPHPGRQHLLVTIGGIDTTMTVVAEADPVAATTRIQAAREVSPAPAGSLLADSVGIRVTNLEGAAATDVPIAWTALDGGGIEPLSTRTDSVGEAWARWTLGPRAGTQRTRVQVGNPRTMPAFTLTATALAETAEAVTLVSGAGQTGRVGAALAKPVVAKVTDRNGNPVGGASVRVAALAGTVADTAAVTDAAGLVHIRWTLGSKAGAQSIELTSGAGKAVRANARALPMEPANVALAAVSASAAGRPLQRPISATVTDAYGNVVSDVQVVFSVSAGSAAPLRVMTDAKGQAATRWTLGSLVGDQLVTAAVRGTTVKTSATVKAVKK